MERPALVIHSSRIQGFLTVILSHVAWTEQEIKLYKNTTLTK